MNFKLYILMNVLFITSSCWATWQSTPNPLTTPWTADVSPDQVWPEYPRPQMVRSNWINLNGLWDYAIVDQNATRPQQWQGQILVPFAVESALSGVKKSVLPDQCLWYHRSFHAPEMVQNKRLLVHFGAVDWQCTLWINDQKVGSHSGGYDSFSFDITDFIIEGDNELFLAVLDPSDEGYQPRGKQVLKPGGIMYTAVTGIWQTVWMEIVPQTYITSLKIVPDVDHSIVHITVIANTSSQVQITGKEIEPQQGYTGQPLEVSVPQIQLWSPDNPYLYDFTVTLFKQGDDGDQVTGYFGMRKIEVAPDDQGVMRLKLNNKVLFQYGPLDQGWWPDGLYTPPTDEAIKYDITMTKKFGMNMARKHVKYECARWYYWCDKMGLLVWQDMPSGDSSRNPASRTNFRKELKTMIDALHNFPCIVMWVPFNEGWGQFDTGDIVQWIKTYDPTRPVNEASGWNDRGTGDISDMHSYPGPGMRSIEEKRVIVLGEFGGLGLPIPNHTWQSQENWGYVSFTSQKDLTDAYVNLLKRMRPLIGQGLAAAVYTQTSDVEIEVNGLLTYDRKVTKMDLDSCNAAAQLLYQTPPKIINIVPSSQHEKQTWQYTTSSPDKNWIKPEYDDSKWQTGSGGFGTEETPGAIVGTVWDSTDIWLRRTFTLDALQQGNLALNIHHDEDTYIYINGELIQHLTGYVTSYVFVPLEEEVLKIIKHGSNTLAVHCHQTGGGQYIDVGLIMIQDL